jgi:putative solute:sodium symporter small subunit
METPQKDYSFSLFHPVSEYGRRNRNLILILVAIWFISIFGFQGLLYVLQKPTPEASLLKFQPVWEKVKDSNATLTEKQDFLNSMILVAGKSSVKSNDRLVLNKAITWSVADMIGDSAAQVLFGNVAELQSIQGKLAKAKDSEYLQLKAELNRIKAAINALANEPTGIDTTNLKEAILPYSLNTEAKVLTPEDWTKLPEIMNFYLVHFQSVLTDTTFIGFPFHYFYTGEFLLFLFVGLCLFYSIRITQLQKKYSIKE